MPQADQGALTGVAGVAAQFGISLASGSPDQSPQFYGELMGLRSFEEALVTSKFSVTVRPAANGKPDSVVNQSLVDWLDIETGRPDGERIELAIAKLSKIFTVIPEVQTSLITVTVQTRWPSLSREVAQRTLELLNEFNSGSRSTRAGTERQFVEGRLAVARDSLSASEERMRRFLEQNRNYTNSPMLTLEQGRLQRQVDFNQQVVVTLMQSAEQARIQELRNTPEITVVNTPVIPALPDRRRLLLKWVLAGTLGIILGAVAAAGSVVFRREQQLEPDVSTDFRLLWADTRADLDRAVTPVRSTWRRLAPGNKT
jgi:uncharacterized protein involved in exopolysaccharide biosynthesis